MSDEIRAWVLWWRYSDGSGAEVVRVYLDEERAKQDRDLAQMSVDKEWRLDETFVYGDCP